MKNRIRGRSTCDGRDRSCYEVFVSPRAKMEAT